MSRLIASTANTITCVSRPSQYGVNTTGPRTSNAPTTNHATLRYALRSGTAFRPSRSRAAIQPGRFDREDDHHRREQREIRQLRNQRPAEAVDQADDHAAGESALQAAHPADDHDDERQRPRIQIRARIPAQERPPT